MNSTIILLLLTVSYLYNQSVAAPQFSFLPLKFFSPVPKVLRIKFFPDDGIKYRKEFEDKFGAHGERLISMLSKGIVNNMQNKTNIPQVTRKSNVSSQLSSLPKNIQNGTS